MVTSLELKVEGIEVGPASTWLYIGNNQEGIVRRKGKLLSLVSI